MRVFVCGVCMFTSHSPKPWTSMSVKDSKLPLGLNVRVKVVCGWTGVLSRVYLPGLWPIVCRTSATLTRSVTYLTYQTRTIVDGNRWNVNFYKLKGNNLTKIERESLPSRAWRVAPATSSGSQRWMTQVGVGLVPVELIKSVPSCCRQDETTEPFSTVHLIMSK